MKKSIFLFFAAILCAMTANAQLYLRGGFNDWGTSHQFVSNICEIELAANTTYEFKIATSNWSSEYGFAAFSATGTKTSNGKNNTSITTGLPGVYRFEFVESTKKLTVTYPELPAPHDITVRAQVPASWTNTITAWVWTSENGTGKEVTPTKDGDYYVVTKNAGALYVIFKNGAGWNGDKNQTVDLCYTEDVCLQLNQSGSAKATATVIECGAVSKDITVKAVVPGAWENTITAWVWPTGGEGKEVTPTKDGNWYVVTENCIELNVIFKNGTGWNGNENQTANITGVSENTCYQISALNKDGEGKCTYTVVDCEAAIEPEAKPVDVYTVVGAETLVGTAWDVNNTDNDMTKQGDGSYVLVKENVELATTGTYEYKVVKNRSWDWKGVNEGNNLTLTGVDVDGTYNVTFTLNKELNALTASLELVEAKKVIPECYVAGDESLTGQNWNAKSVLMTYDEATEVYTATLTAVPAGTHNMKVVYGGEWLGFDHLATPAPANVKEGDDKKIQFTLAEAGDVTVTYHATNGIGLVGTFAAPETKYYIAGTENLTGFNWKENGLEMTKEGDVYKHTFSEMNAGIYEFKITDGTWTNPWGFDNLAANYVGVTQGKDGEGNPNGNIIITTEEAKNIIVIFDPANNKITLEDWAIVTHTYTIAGDAALCGEAWNWELAANDMTNNGDGTYTWTKAGVEVNGELSFKVFVDYKSEPAYPSENWVIKPENYEGVGVYDVIITFTESSKEVVVALTKQVVTPTPDYIRTGLTVGNYGTICLPYASDNFTGATFFEVVGKEGDKVFFDEVTTLEAGKPYIFLADETEIKVAQIGESADEAGKSNSLQGTFTQIDKAEDNILVGNYMVVNNVIKKCGANCGLAANRAYFIAGELESLSAPSARVPGRRRVAIGQAPQVATGMENIDASAQPVKTIINGQLFILRGEKMYDAQGKLVK